MSIEQLRPKPFISQTGKVNSHKSHIVRIEHGSWSVQGISKNPLNFKLSAKYGDLFNGLIPGAELLQKTGDASLTTGIFSQKYFQGGNNLDMNVEFRIYDDGTQDINPCSQGARNLANMTVSYPTSLGGAIGSVGGAITKSSKAIQDLIDKFKEDGLKGLGEGGIDTLTTFSDTINKRTVTLNILNLFRCEKMAIQDVSVTYSEAQTHTGPLFADFSVSLISMQAITRGSDSYGVDNILSNRNYNIKINGRDFQEIDNNKR